ncbi:9183_t:CDS:2 [Paraglomus brasilianum]|uniref:9183_t:CDS:1 n=1 Tax=Paraglomus brasilianum TaxID=144538 RepID=A0A9N9D6P4_9GLOM|nr:9183_t:CDS:2 [Paraglomus brasilianum]
MVPVPVNVKPAEFCKFIKKMLRIRTKVKINNQHNSISLENPRVFTTGSQKNVAENVGPQNTRTIAFRGNFAIKGAIVYEIQNVTQKPHYLVITWAVKGWLRCGKNSVTCHVLNNLDDEPLEQLYKQLHTRQNRQYVGANAVPMHQFAYRISGGISNGANAEIAITLQ